MHRFGPGWTGWPRRSRRSGTWSCFLPMQVLFFFASRRPAHPSLMGDSPFVFSLPSFSFSSSTSPPPPLFPSHVQGGGRSKGRGGGYDDDSDSDFEEGASRKKKKAPKAKAAPPPPPPTRALVPELVECSSGGKVGVFAVSLILCGEVSCVAVAGVSVSLMLMLLTTVRLTFLIAADVLDHGSRFACSRPSCSCGVVSRGVQQTDRLEKMASFPPFCPSWAGADQMAKDFGKPSFWLDRLLVVSRPLPWQLPSHRMSTHQRTAFCRPRNRLLPVHSISRSLDFSVSRRHTPGLPTQVSPAFAEAEAAKKFFSVVRKSGTARGRGDDASMDSGEVWHACDGGVSSWTVRKDEDVNSRRHRSRGSVCRPPQQ